MFAERSSICCILTGASRGFGAALALDIAEQAKKTKNPLTFVLVARSLDGLEKTKAAVHQIYSSSSVHCVSADLGDLLTLPTTLENIFEKVKHAEFKSALLINNAGVLGDVSKRVQDVEKPQDFQSHFNVNVTAPFCLLSKFIKEFNGVKRYAVYISTLMAVEAFPGFSFYCTSKAASEMAHKVAAKEEPDVRVLCYAPGPLKTDMIDSLVQNTFDMEIKKALEKKNILEPHQSSAKLVNLLLEDKFISGKHIDYFDC